MFFWKLSKSLWWWVVVVVLTPSLVFSFDQAEQQDLTILKAYYKLQACKDATRLLLSVAAWPCFSHVCIDYVHLISFLTLTHLTIYIFRQSSSETPDLELKSINQPNCVTELHDLS